MLMIRPPLVIAPMTHMILGRDLLEASGLVINFNDHTMTWDKATFPMKEYGSQPTQRGR